VELRPLNESHQDLLLSLQRQDDVWEFIGTLPVPTAGEAAEAAQAHMFAITEGPTSLGFAGLVRSQTIPGNDFELLCAIRAEAQQRGVAKRACQLVLDWAFNSAKLERIIACIDDGNEAARAIAMKLGMTELETRQSGRTVYVKYRDERSLTGAR
jgi:RimJ/RimL family protein N-acetyltransferase